MNQSRGTHEQAIPHCCYWFRAVLPDEPVSIPSELVQTGENKSGVNFGGGFELKISRHLGLAFDGRYHAAFYHLRMFNAGGGVVWYLN